MYTTFVIILVVLNLIALNAFAFKFYKELGRQKWLIRENEDQRMHSDIWKENADIKKAHSKLKKKYKLLKSK